MKSIWAAIDSFFAEFGKTVGTLLAVALIGSLGTLAPLGKQLLGIIVQPTSSSAHPLAIFYSAIWIALSFLASCFILWRLLKQRDRINALETLTSKEIWFRAEFNNGDMLWKAWIKPPLEQYQSIHIQAYCRQCGEGIKTSLNHDGYNCSPKGGDCRARCSNDKCHESPCGHYEFMQHLDAVKIRAQASWRNGRKGFVPDPLHA